jgi:hypothetical protein
VGEDKQESKAHCPCQLQRPEYKQFYTTTSSVAVFLSGREEDATRCIHNGCYKSRNKQQPQQQQSSATDDRPQWRSLGSLGCLGIRVSVSVSVSFSVDVAAQNNNNNNNNNINW